MKKISIIVARMPELGISKLISAVERIYDLGSVPIPLIYPLHYDLQLMDWDRGKYFAENLIKQLRESVGFENLPLLIVGERGLYAPYPYICFEEQKVCLLTEEKKIDEVVRIIEEWEKNM